MRKVFGIDIDGTVTSPASMIPLLNNDFQLNLTLQDITKYDLTDVINIPEEQINQWFTNNEALIYENSPISSYAQQVLKEWTNQFDLYYISARSSHMLDLTKKWFQKNSLPYNHIELIGTHNKVEAAKKFHVDIFFEDKHDNAVMIHECCKIPVLLFNTPYNQDPVPEGVIRVNNWLEARDWVKRWVAGNELK